MSRAGGIVNSALDRCVADLSALNGPAHRRWSMRFRADRDASRPAYHPKAGTRERLNSLLFDYWTAKKFYASNPVGEPSVPRVPFEATALELERLRRVRFLHDSRIAIMTEIRRIRLARDARRVVILAEAAE